MEAQKNQTKAGFFKTTVVGGLLFLVPFVVLLMILTKAIQIMMVVAKPVDALIPIESVGGIAFVNVVAILLIVLTCFVAGLAARSAAGQKLFRVTDGAMMAFIPVYAMMKERFFSYLGDVEDAGALTPVLVTFDDHAMVAFEVERGASGKVTVFLPGSPDPWGGSVAMVEPERVEPLANTNKKEIGHMLKKLGIGSEGILDGEPLAKAS